MSFIIFSLFYLTILGAVSQLLIASVPVNEIKHFMQADTNYKETHNSKYEGQRCHISTVKARSCLASVK
jgi:hypothetical protein